MELTKIQKENIKIFNEKVEKKEYKLEKLECLFCKANSSTKLYNMDRYGIMIDTVICDRCGLIRSDPYYTNETLDKYYQNEYRSIYTESKKATEDFFAHEVMIGKQVLLYLGSLFGNNFKNKTVFEIGTGAGGILLPFKEAGADVHGCDLGDEYIKYGISKGIDIVQGDISVLKSKGLADIIILNHVLEHFIDPVKKLDEIKSLLKEDGVIYISVPGVISHITSYKTFKMYLQNAHAYHYSLASLVNLMKIVDFGLEKGDEKVRAVFSKKGKKLELKNNVLLTKVYILLSIYLPVIFIPYLLILKVIKKVISMIKV